VTKQEQVKYWVTSAEVDFRAMNNLYNSKDYLVLMKYAREFEDPIEPHPFLSSEFNETEPFVYEILHSGIEIT
jgi:hypothetical protein